MNQTVNDVLSEMVRIEDKRGLKHFSETENGLIQLQTDLTEIGHDTILKYDVSGTDFIHFEIVHTFGVLDLRVSAQEAAEELLQILLQNGGEAQYLGLTRSGGELWARLNSYHIFLKSWSNRDIADVMNTYLRNLVFCINMLSSNLRCLRIITGSQPSS